MHFTLRQITFTQHTITASQTNKHIYTDTCIRCA